MSEIISQEIKDLFRQQVIRITSDAATADKVSIQADALAFLSQSSLLVVNAPIAGIEKLDFKAMLDGQPVLDNTPVMYWYFPDGGFGEARSSIPEGFYTVVAHEQQGTVSLRDAQGKAIAEGDLGVSIGPQDPSTGTAEKPKVSGNIDSAEADLFPPHVKVCGHVTISVNGKSLTIQACIEAGF